MVETDLRPPGLPTATVAGPLRAAALPESGEDPPLMDLGSMLQESPPWLVSAVIHMAVMIIFGLLIVQANIRSDLLLDAGYSDDVGDLLHDDLDMMESEFEVDDAAIPVNNLPVVDDPLSVPNMADVTPLPAMPTGPTLAPTAIGIALTGREPGMKQAMLLSGGGNAKTEGAVALGLKWLASQQHKSGMWSLSGPYPDGSSTENPEAATAMALLAFQGAGYTPNGDSQNAFTPVVRRGWNALLKHLESDGRFFHDVPTSHQLYTQAQCTIALCELYAMTGDPSYYEAAQKAVDYCVRIQAPEGGWRYQPGVDSDMSVTGWFVMALQSARMGGIEVPSPVFDKIAKFLDSVARDEGARYGYQIQAGATLPLSAEGLLCRQYLGWPHDDQRLRAGVEYLLVNLPEWDKRNAYYWYYATQVLHHMEGKPWRTWNERMRELLPEHQEKRGKERGSWHPRGDRWGDAGGRLYVTCLSIYTLEVYYRHLPLYRGTAFGETR